MPTTETPKRLTTRRAHRVATTLVGAVILIGVSASPASAHGVGKRGDLPLPLWQFVWAAVIALGVSVAAAGILWTAPRLARLAVGRPLPGWTAAVVRAAMITARVLGLVIFAVTLSAGLFVDESLARNIAPFAIFVALWVGMQFLSPLVGDVYRSVNPLDTIVRGMEAIGVRTGSDESPLTHWPAAASLLGFLWLELAYHDPASPRVIGWLMLVYSLVHISLALRFGRRWLQVGEGFAAIFTVMSALAPVWRDESGRLRLRVPGSGLATMEVRPGTAALILIALGGTSFDGLSRTEFWADVAGLRSGWELTAVQTLGMVWMVAIAYALYALATRLVAGIAGGDRGEAFDQYAPSLVPILLGYSIAHYFSLFVLDGGQDFLILLSDPLDLGWNLLGTSDWRVNFLLVSATTIAWVQAVGIIVGHVAGVLAAHDRALELYDGREAVRSQYPMVGVMIVYTVGALVLLLGA